MESITAIKSILNIQKLAQQLQEKLKLFNNGHEFELKSLKTLINWINWIHTSEYKLTEEQHNTVCDFHQIIKNGLEFLNKIDSSSNISKWIKVSSNKRKLDDLLIRINLVRNDVLSEKDYTADWKKEGIESSKIWH